MVEETGQLTNSIHVLKAYFPNDLTPEQKLQLEEGLEVFRQENSRVIEQYVSTVREEYAKPKDKKTGGMISGNVLSKNIRPGVLIYLLGSVDISQ